MVKWDLWWTKWRRGRFSPSTSVFPAIHSTKFSILTITRGGYNRPVSGRRDEWTQFGLHPPLCKLKKNYSLSVILYICASFNKDFESWDHILWKIWWLVNSEIQGGFYRCWLVHGSTLHGDQCTADCEAHTDFTNESIVCLLVTFGTK
jgi:hypothetical protein